jgi:hypothetical protein
VHALRAGPDTKVRLTGQLLDSDLRLLDETIDWLIAAGARHIIVEAGELIGDRAVLSSWLGGYRQQSLVKRHVLTVGNDRPHRSASRRRASR